MYHAANTGDEGYLASLSRNLILPEPEEWFGDVFDEETAAVLAEDYKTISEVDIVEVFTSIAKQGQEDIKVVMVASKEEATDLQIIAVQKMENPVTIYSVYFLKPGETRGMQLWSFAYADNAFRLIGKLTPLEEEQDASE